jgi:catechol 2,3-dioxygenase-like lactoylglutathione lyase family enzyme
LNRGFARIAQITRIGFWGTAAFVFVIREICVIRANPRFKTILPKTQHTEHGMKQHLAQVAIVVNDYDEAIRFYTETLGFELIEDTVLSETKRWVLVAPKGGGCRLLLAKAASDEQRSRVGNQTGGRVFLFLHTDDFWRDYHDWSNKGVRFVRPPSQEPYGTVAVFEDLYGNLWDLIEVRGTTYDLRIE